MKFFQVVLKHGGNAEYWKEHKTSDWTWFSFKMKQKIFSVFTNFILTSPLGKLLDWDKGLEYAGIQNFNITHLDPKEMIMPVDLIFEHLALQTF